MKANSRRRSLVKKHTAAVIRAHGPVKRADAHAVVPLRERKLDFGGKWEYAPAPEDHKYIPIAPRHELFIDGKFAAPHSGKYFDSINPATEQKLTEIAQGDSHDVDAAVQSARRAFEGEWGKLNIVFATAKGTLIIKLT